MAVNKSKVDIVIKTSCDTICRYRRRKRVVDLSDAVSPWRMQGNRRLRRDPTVLLTCPETIYVARIQGAKEGGGG